MNLTPEEQYRLHGRIEGPACVELLDAHLKADAFSDGCLTDAKASYPNEDFLQDVIKEIGRINDMVEALRKNMRSNNREIGDNIVEAMEELKLQVEDLQQTTHNNTEYGLEEIRKVEKAME